MQIFTLFEARMRALHAGRRTSADLTLGFQSRVLPASAGVGDTCDYVFLCAGETQHAFAADRHEWWGCLRGGLRLSAPGHDSLLMGGGELFAPAPGVTMQVRAMVDSILVRAVPQQHDDAACGVSLPAGARHCALGSIAAVGAEEAVGTGRAEGACLQPEFIQLDQRIDDWAQRLQARGLRWALCYRGAVGLHWHDARARAGVDVAFLQPGAIYAPDPDESCRLDVVLPGTGLLCCFGPADDMVPGHRGHGAWRTDGCAAARPALVAA
ncbi:hypothetical protein [Cupriavidus necator]|uniref:hypothetical protein n=1 Tax=Cupriavidus necator TaxID=106590 RepID=UPI00339D69F0